MPIHSFVLQRLNRGSYSAHSQLAIDTSKGQRLCSLQRLDQIQPFVNRDEIPDAVDNEIMMNPDITSDIFDNLSDDGGDQNIDMNYYQNFMNYDMNNHENINNQNFLINPHQREMTSLESYKSVKVNIMHIVKDNSSIAKVNEIVEKMHILRMLTTMILKLYILHKKFVSIKALNIKNIINERFIIILMESIAAKKETVRRRSERVRKKPKILDSYSLDASDDSTQSSDASSDDDNNIDEIRHNLLSFINTIILEDNELSPEIKDILKNGIDIRSLQNSVGSMAREIVTSYEQNIIQNYKTYIERFVNVFYLRGKLAELEAIENSGLSKEEKKDEKMILLLKYRHLKDDLVQPDPQKYLSKSPSALRFIKIHKQNLFPKSR